MTNTLDDLRNEIDELDQKLQDLLNQRAALAHKVAEVKTATDPNPVFYRPEREAQVLRRVKERNQGPLDGETMARFFREVMSACLALEQRMKVAFLGPEGTFTQQAALKHFGHAVESLPLAAIDEVFREVESGAANYGVVPVENSTEGVVNHTLDTFMTSSLKICGEVELRIHHHLLAGEHTRQDKVTRVYSHQQTLAQCRQWLDAHMPGVERIAVSSNAEAARRLKDEWNALAIAGEMAEELYGLTAVQRNIEDRPDNTTRFIIIGRQDTPPSGCDKTSLMISGKNRPGLLYEVLSPFRDEGINLTRLESRPSRTANWSYVFFVDCEGHKEDDTLQAVLDKLEAAGNTIKLLGSYPKAVL
ncbi:MAG: prephenate dehydratase [Alcanivorax borkumensis]|jgi:chorismate mutase/prephenate dehydratase|uniref:Bifunctional chorismate mutase/prephenate dehydratase n=1 Tax=Alcanivorax borkumensis (strain ATCC 700651 / DSM 11573 / NCIMB 13689 / SK2) TaxID=393595 RepID=Q0VNQ1_ALCBS|nr:MULTISPECIES: prephenate dehydratase [Alcanivorax]OJH08455.1 MAG: prephenate dehydratase [Alcanivorax borkumensis]EUC69477.1 prephenate dehydratase [Alcanivorax sp. 97CO-5]PKG01389.1 chorismate mutase [Alcanivorax sp. 97CO-6]CAL17197.1 P-protein, chorismate mutase/prephenate dehydratase [Alcanivorax borkumensis SK2]BAP14655.1 chorismate mutase/prephenate dehydratase [Alcanivorax sp. NBRC 101098]